MNENEKCKNVETCFYRLVNALGHFRDSVDLCDDEESILFASNLQDAFDSLYHDIEAGHLYFFEDENNPGEYKLFINTSDLFAWGTADARVISFEEFFEILELKKKHPNQPIYLAYACKKEGMEPQRHPNYKGIFDLLKTWGVTGLRPGYDPGFRGWNKKWATTSAPGWNLKSPIEN